jgi:hypothetical protein
LEKTNISVLSFSYRSINLSKKTNIHNTNQTTTNTQSCRAIHSTRVTTRSHLLPVE